MIRTLLKPIALFILLTGWGTAANAAGNAVASSWIQTEYGAVRMVAATDSLDENGEAVIGVQLRLVTGWKTYWRTPGETGVPTQFDWSRSENLGDAEVAWPTPSRFSEFEMQTFGYDREVIFPVRIKAGEPGAPVDLKLRLTYGVCKDICIPMELDLALSVSESGEHARTRYAGAIERFQRRIPGENGAGGMRIDKVVVEQGYVLSEIEVYASSDERFGWPDAAVEMPPGYRMGVPTVNVGVDRRSVNLRMPLFTYPGAEPLEGKPVTVTLWDENGRAIEHTLEIERRASSVESRLD